MSDRLRKIRSRLEAHDQAHVLSRADELSADQLEHLLDQIEQIDFEALDELIDRHVHHPDGSALPGELEPAPYFPEDMPEDEKARYRADGERLLREGRVAAFTVAGGQGTRLGWNGPKGTFPATPVTGKPLFRVFAEQILASQRKFGVTIPWYIMTSPINDADTRAFFLDNNCFGLDRKNLFLFPQGVMPSLDAKTGRILLSAKHEIAMNPNGHGGSIKALRDSGAIEDMAARGIEHISYFQVDNPLAKVIDPLFLGLHASAEESSGEMSSKMVAKTDPEEKVGVFCRSEGKTIVVEYSDLPEELARQTTDDGALRFLAGNIAIHLFGVPFIERLTAEKHRFGLPYHRALKKVPHIDVESGAPVDPAEPNAIKLESFVFDALPLAERSLVLETSRVEEFAPIKNADGRDSAASSHELQSERHARWLEASGVTVPRDQEGRPAARLEISPLTALDPGEIPAAELPEVIRPGAEIAI